MSVLITFEGGDGSGKSTQARLLADWLSEKDYEVTVLREPGGTVLGDELRAWLKSDGSRVSPLAGMFLFAAARADLVERLIRPALAAPDAVVICDRYMDSTLAYQGYGLGLNLDAIRCVNEIAIGGLVPDMTILLDLPPDDVAVRLAERGRGETASTAGGVDGSSQSDGHKAGRDAFEDRGPEFWRRVREGYLEMAEGEPRRWYRLDANQPQDELAGRIRSLIGVLLPRAAESKLPRVGDQIGLFDAQE